MDVNAIAGPSRIPYTSIDTVQTQDAITVTAKQVFPIARDGPVNDSKNAQRSSYINGKDNEDARDRSATADDPQHRARGVYNVNHPALKRFRTGYCYDFQMTLHTYRPDPDDPEDSHPEVPERIVRTFQRLAEADGGRYLARMQKVAIREASKAEAMLVHTEELWDRVEAFAVQIPEFYAANKNLFSFLSLYVNEYSPLCARLSLGGVIETCRAVAEDRIQNAFAIVRPPGHHAEPDQEMGFCFFNNAAVAAEWLKYYYPETIKKVLILDWDVHHGNGTQKHFWTDPSVLYISIHLHEGGSFYPGGPYGSAEMSGQGPGRGTSVNIPWEDDGMGDADYLYAFQRIVMPIAYEFAPDFVIVSAGFDAARGDTLGRCDVTPAGYAHMTHMLSALAGGKMVVALEGGYKVDSVANSALECIKVLLGETPPTLESMTASASATMTTHVVAAQQSKYWKSIRPAMPDRLDLSEIADVTPLSEVLKAHRTHHLYHTHQLYNVPISNAVLEDLFKDQMLITDNVFTSDTIVVLAHDIGHIYAEINPISSDVNLENSFLLDVSSRIVEWTLGKEYALVDVNLLPHSDRVIGRDRIELAKQEFRFLEYVWVNVIKLALNAQNVVFIGHSLGCNAIVNLINTYGSAMLDSNLVKSVVLLHGSNPPMRLATKTQVPGLRDWFHGRSLAIFPAIHIAELDEATQGKRYGNVQISNDPRPTHVLHNHWQDVQDHIQRCLTLLATNGNGNGSIVRTAVNAVSALDQSIRID